MTEEIKNHEIILGPNTKVTSDKRSGAKVISLPFDFPDDTRGIVIICKIKEDNWVPMNEITSVVINFK